MPDTRRLRRNPAVEEAPLADELMLFDPAQSKFFVLNATMSFTWSCCDGQHSIDDICDQLVTRFNGVTPAQAGEDVAAAIEQLYSAGLLLDAV